MRKLRHNRGETLVEVLAAVLVSALSVALLFSYVMASSSIDRKAYQMDTAHYEAVSDADGEPEQAGTGTVTITDTNADPSRRYAPSDFNVVIRGSEGLYSYR